MPETSLEDRLIESASSEVRDLIGGGDLFDTLFEDLFGGLNLPPLLTNLIGASSETIVGVFDQIIADNDGTLSPDGLINAFVPNNLKPLLDVPDPITGITPRDTFGEAIYSGEFDQAVGSIVPFTGVDVTDQTAVDQLTESFTSAFDLITVTKAGTVLVDRSSLNLAPPLDIKDTFGTDAPEFSTYVSSVEELEMELRTVSRDISEVIVHWTESYTNSNLDADQIKTMAVALGATDIPYHYIIRRDGSLQRGFPVDQQASHCPELDHDLYSISICFVGGLNVSTGTANDEEFTQAASLTRSQFNTFYEFMRVFYDVWPGGQALGHGDIVPERTDPGFDVRQYVFNCFRKYSIYDDPTTETAYSPADISTWTYDFGYPTVERYISETDLERELTPL